MTVEIGQKAPDFSAPDETGQNISLKNFLGKKIFLYFYPKDDTPGCTLESCGFRDMYPDLQALNAVVLGVSKDSIKSHVKFKGKYDLPFPLISDETAGVCEMYQTFVEKSMYGKKYMGIERSTFLIDEAGVVQQIWRGVSVSGHMTEVLNALKS